MNLEVITYQPMAVEPTPPVPSAVLQQYPIAAKCPSLVATLNLGLWIYPPFDADISVDPTGQFKVSVHQGLEALFWPERMEALVEWGSTWWCSKIKGVFQVDPGFILTTPLGNKLVVTQPFNAHNRAFFTQTGLVDSDFFKAPFTINLQPALGITQFSLRRNEPIAQLLRADKLLGPLSMSVAPIEARRETLQFWRDYIAAVYGPGRGREGEPPRVASVYRAWRSASDHARPMVPTRDFE